MEVKSSSVYVQGPGARGGNNQNPPMSNSNEACRVSADLIGVSAQHFLAPL